MTVFPINLAICPIQTNLMYSVIKTRTFLSDPKLLNDSVHTHRKTIQDQ